MPKKIFIAATRQNDGKTTISLGLMAALKAKFKNIGFIKPIGQRYLVEQGYNIDEDSYLIEEIFGIKSNLQDMSPVAIEKGFTQKYIENPNRKSLENKIVDSFRKISAGSDLVVIEGTGHAGVGSVFDMSNAAVARMLDSRVVIISAGGIGRPIDEVMLSVPLFEKMGVEIIGVIINKVQATKYRKIKELVIKGFGHHKLDVLGVIPYLRMLDMPNMEHMEETLGGRFISGTKNNMLTIINNIIVATADGTTVLRQMRERSLVIVSGDRDKLLEFLLKENKKKKNNMLLAGIIITCDLMPKKKIRKLMEESGVPTLLVPDDTYNVITKIEDMIVKIRPNEKDKIDMVTRLVNDHIDTDKIISSL
jgi:hypothetical protein